MRGEGREEESGRKNGTVREPNKESGYNKTHHVDHNIGHASIFGHFFFDFTLQIVIDFCLSDHILQTCNKDWKCKKNARGRRNDTLNRYEPSAEQPDSSVSLRRPY